MRDNRMFGERLVRAVLSTMLVVGLVGCFAPSKEIVEEAGNSQK